MLKFFKTFFKLLKRTFLSWDKNEPYGRSATIAYYALFSLPSLLIIVASIAGYFFGKKAVQGKITEEIEDFIGMEAAEAIENMISNAALDESSTGAIIFGIAMLLFGATGVFFQLKLAMNNIWNVAAKNANFLRIVLNRVISLGMVLVLGLLLLISLVISTLLRILRENIEVFYPDITAFFIDIANFTISFVIITTLFAAIFKLLPDVKIRWKVTYLGAALTTFLFLIGEFLIGFYFGQSNPASVYGGASSVVLILLWVYYTCMIVFFGAEFTVQYALYKNETVVPNKYGEPAIYQELEKLKKKRVQIEEEKKIIDNLRSNFGWSDEQADESQKKT